MSWILDVLLAAVALGTVMYYSKKGFVRSVLGFGRIMVSAVMAWFLSTKVGRIFVEKFLMEWTTGKVGNFLTSMFDAGAEKFDLSSLFEKLPDTFVMLLKRFGTDMNGLQTQYGEMTEATRGGLWSMAETIATPLSDAIGRALAFAAVFLACYLLFALLSGVLGKIFELPVLKQINGLLGLVLGMVCGVLNALIFCTVGYYVVKYAGAITGKFDAMALMENTRLFWAVAKYKFF